jgi:four helix bundle protein
MNEGEFKRRTKQLALRIIRLVEALPQSRTAEVIGKQLIRSATSVGANYRSACRGKSTADVIAKLSLVEEEADESLYWMELIVEAGLLPAEKLNNLVSETNEILAMTVASIKTLRSKSKVQNLKSKIQNLKSKIQNPKYDYRPFDSRTRLRLFLERSP